MTLTPNQVLESVQELPPQQQEMLFEILHQRRIQTWRENVVHDAEQAWEDFQAGCLRPQSAEEAIATLYQALDTETETLYLLSTPANAGALARAIEQDRAGQAQPRALLAADED